ncbi:hypothetical protein PHYBOEH_006180 [Phytophthora boehmeriae]|uniref:Uncharacterized protein n=1 Tax=Phytophthora boehmeriae TaxID=109152 RepID=A0A8T1WL61_9STRA|nr:hypothetical protein PHYBOEH_006180 [Phytophthora boehmeriae]
MADDAHYRQVLRQMQDEFTRAVAALEKQVAALTQHNELLSTELALTKQQQQEWTQQATDTVNKLQQQLETQTADAQEAQRRAAEREQTLSHEVAALKSLLQQEQDYWQRYDQASKEDRDRLTRQLAEAKAEGMQHYDRNQKLRREMKTLQNRVDAAMQTSTGFEQRLTAVVQEKEHAMQELEKQLSHYKKRYHEKRAQNKYLTEALVRLQERRQDSGDSSSSGTSPKTTAVSAAVTRPSPTTSPVSMEIVNPPVEQSLRRVRKRELTLPEEIKAAAASVTTAERVYKSKRLSSSRANTSPTSSSPEISPRSAPYKRPSSVATTAHTTSDHNSFNNNSSSGSLRSLRSMRNVTGRRISSRNSSSDSDNIDVSPRRTAGTMTGPNSTSGRLERELNGLRRKLDAFMPDASRW